MAVRGGIENLDLELEIQCLVLLVKETERSVLAFALYRSVADREMVARELRQRLSLPVHEFALSQSRKNPIDVIRRAKIDGRAVIFLYDVEEAFPEALGYLNLQREFFSDIPHAVILWVREYGLQEVATKAPDFWSWRSEVFDFRSPEERTPLMAVQTAVAEPFFYSDRGDLERRLSFYQGLLQDYSQEEHRGGPPPDQELIAELERKIGLAHYYLGEWPKALEHLRKAVDMSRQLKDRPGEAAALNNLAVVLLKQGDYTEARRLYEKSLEIAQELGKKDVVAASFNQLGILAQETADYTEARRLHEESLRIAHELRNKDLIAASLHQLGVLAQETGDYTQAHRLYEESLQIAKELGNKSNTAVSLHQLGILAKKTGDYTQAHRLYEESLQIAKELGNKSIIALNLGRLGELAENKGDLEEATLLIAQAHELLSDLNSPDQETAVRVLARIGKKMGQERFEKILAQAQRDR